MATLGAFSLSASSSIRLPKSSTSSSPICCASASGIHRRVRVYEKAISLGSISHYVAAGEGASAFLRDNHPHRIRRARRAGGGARAATMEEIDAQKSTIEGETREKMDKTIESLHAHFSAVRTGRANPALLDRIQVEYYGSPVGLKSIAQISTPDSRSILVQPYDKSCLKMIEKAIVNSDLDMTPNNDGQVIRMIVPQLTADRRKELTKLVGKQAEEGKVAIRNVRRDAIKAYEKLEKEKKLSEDNVKDLTSDIQKLTDEYIKKIDSIQKQKEQELMTV